MTPDEFLANWSAYLRPVDREDFKKQLLAMTALPQPEKSWPDGSDFDKGMVSGWNSCLRAVVQKRADDIYGGSHGKG